MVVFLLLYVDGILLIDNDVGLLLSIKIQLSTQFQMKDLGKTIYSWDKDPLRSQE